MRIPRRKIQCISPRPKKPLKNAETPNAYKNFVDPDLKRGLDMTLALLLVGHAQGLSSTREERVIAF